MEKGPSGRDLPLINAQSLVGLLDCVDIVLDQVEHSPDTINVLRHHIRFLMDRLIVVQSVSNDMYTILPDSDLEEVASHALSMLEIDSMGFEQNVSVIVQGKTIRPVNIPTNHQCSN